jgi:hypothetical protein
MAAKAVAARLAESQIQQQNSPVKTRKKSSQA